MSRYEFEIETWFDEEWFWEWSGCQDRSSYWLRLGPWEFSFVHAGTYDELATATFDRHVAILAIREWLLDVAEEVRERWARWSPMRG